MTRLRLLRLLQLVAAGASFLTTMLGFLHLTGGGGISLFAAGLFSLIVQALVVVSVDECTRPSLGWRWPLSVALYVVVAFVSSVFSVGFYFDLFAADDFAEAQFKRQGDLMLEEATRVDAEFSEVVARLETLSAYAEEQRALEATVGKTCEHSQGGGSGPAMAKRKFEARLIEELAESYRRRRDVIAKGVASITAARGAAQPGQVTSIEALRAPWNRIRASLNGADLAAVVEPLLRYESAGYPEDDPRYRAFAGAQHACRDGGTIAQLQGLLDAPMPRLAQVPLVQLDAKDPKQVIFLVFNGFLDALMDREVSASGGVSITSREFLPALGFGVVVDLAILVLGLLITAARKKHNDEPPTRTVQVATDLVGKWASARSLLQAAGAVGAPTWGGDDMGDVREVFRELRQFLLVRHGDRHWLVVPKGAREDKVFDPGHRFAAPLRELLDQALFVLQQEGIASRRPCEVPKGLDPARLLAGRFAPLGGEALLGTPEPERFSAYEVFVDLDELERNTAGSGPVADFERLLGSAMPSWLPSASPSRFFEAQCRASSHVVGQRLLARVEQDGGRQRVRLGGAGLPAATLQRWLEKYRFRVSVSRFGGRTLELDGHDLSRLQGLAAGRRVSFVEGDRPRERGHRPTSLAPVASVRSEQGPTEERWRDGGAAVVRHPESAARDA